MTEVETSRPESDLTGDNNVTQESVEGSTEPSSELTPEEKKQFQAALQKSQERAKAEQKQREELQAELDHIRKMQKEQELSKMSDSDKYRAIAEQALEDKSRTKIGLLISKATSGKNLSPAFVDMMTNAPWEIPSVKEDLPSDYTWEDVENAVANNIDSYVDSLVMTNSTASKEEPSMDENPKKVDSERAGGNTVVKKHVYTLQEISRIKQDPADWEKHREAILKQLSEYGGQLPQA